MVKVRSLGLLIGTGKCNSGCAHCAGVSHRKYAPKQDGVIDEDLIEKTIRECYEQGARSLSISGSGEPTLSPIAVTKTLELTDKLRKEGFDYRRINLYSNGIRIGQDKAFSDQYLPQWKALGLNWIYITVHDTDERKNAMHYHVEEYPLLRTIFSRIHNVNLLVRVNLVLSKENIHNPDRFRQIVQSLIKKKADKISAWPIRNLEDKVDIDLMPDQDELEKMQAYARTQSKLSVYTEDDRTVYETGQKLTLFPDGTLSSSWCN